MECCVYGRSSFEGFWRFRRAYCNLCIDCLYEVGWNYCFQAHDLVFFQGHSAPGIYARAYLEGRLDDAALALYRQDTQGGL